MRREIISNKAEAQFAASVEAAGKTWFREPKKFKLPDPHYSYTPDFFVIEDNTYYEIVGTRQAFSYARARIDCFRLTYPDLRLEVVNIGAWSNGPRRARKPRVVQAHTKRRQLKRLGEFTSADLRPQAVEIVAAARRVGIRSLRELAERAGTSYPETWAALRSTKWPAKGVLARLSMCVGVPT